MRWDALVGGTGVMGPRCQRSKERRVVVGVGKSAKPPMRANTHWGLGDLTSRVHVLGICLGGGGGRCCRPRLTRSGLWF